MGTGKLLENAPKSFVEDWINKNGQIIGVGWAIFLIQYAIKPSPFAMLHL